MNDNPQEDVPDIDQKIRINELRESAREAAGGEMTSWENEDTPPQIAEAFWSNVLAYESAEPTCHFNQLEEQGIEMLSPDELDDEQITAKLWEVIHALAKLSVFLSSTDHLCDRELYKHLWNESLREFTPDLPPGSGWVCQLDILGSCSEEDMHLQLKHYADEQWREQWRKDFPDDEVPAHVDPPFDRDRKLPQSPDA